MIKYLFIFLLILTSCQTVYQQQERKPQWAVPIETNGVPNLFKINNMLFRSSQPTKEGMESLRTMGIRTVINLRSMNSDKSEAAATGLRFEHISFKPWHPEDEDVIEVMRIISKPENGPFLIHCRKGSDRTGFMCAMYRIIYQNWTKEDAIDELVHGGYGYNRFWKILKNYIENVDVVKIRIKIGQSIKNSIFIISPYKYEGSWVFDDPDAGLSKEPFVSGADAIMDKLVSGIPNAEKGFRLLFSASPFPGYSLKLDWKREEYDGNWYYCEKYDMEGWLCPALFKYFDSAPREIYVKAEVKK